MMEFGEKIKQLREEKGMTQQTMAEMLYVTRQAVSRWECGARYPDLLTAKKIAQILNVTIDELLSGEELKENIEREPLLAQPMENIIQTVLYTIATIAYMLMCTFSLYSLVCRGEALAHTPAGQVSFLDVIVMAGYVINLGAALTGLVLSVKNRLTAKVTGYIMSIPYLLYAFFFLMTYIDIQIKHNGYLGISAWATDLLVPLVLAGCILLYFGQKERRLPLGIIIMICVLASGYIALVMKNRLGRTTDLGFAVGTVHCMGKMGMVFLLGYQAYIWNKKKMAAYKNVK